MREGEKSTLFDLHGSTEAILILCKHIAMCIRLSYRGGTGEDELWRAHMRYM